MVALRGNVPIDSCTVDHFLGCGSLAHDPVDKVLLMGGFLMRAVAAFFLGPVPAEERFVKGRSPVPICHGCRHGSATPSCVSLQAGDGNLFRRRVDSSHCGTGGGERVDLVGDDHQRVDIAGGLLVSTASDPNSTMRSGRQAATTASTASAGNPCREGTKS